MNSKLISVIMANYKTPVKYLEESINSILNQTYQNFELIIIDDNSCDASTEYIENLEDERVVTIKNNENLGPAVSRNKGIDIAKGDYIAILDSDDIAIPERLEIQLDFMENNPDVIVCAGWFEKFGNINMLRKPVIDDFEIYRCQLLFANIPISICHSTAMIRKSCIDEYCLRYDVTLPKSQDYGMWVVCSKLGRIHIINKVLAKYRTHEAQISTRGVVEQSNLADLVSRRQLQELGVGFCEGENRWRHSMVENSVEYLKFYEWIEKIKEANKEKKLFDIEKMEIYLDKKLFEAIKRMPRIEIIKTFVLTNNHTRRLILKQIIR